MSGGQVLKKCDNELRLHARERSFVCTTFEGIDVNNEALRHPSCARLCYCASSTQACELNIPRQEFGTAGNWQILHAHEWVKKVQPFIREDYNLMGRMLTRGSTGREGRASDGETDTGEAGRKSCGR